MTPAQGKASGHVATVAIRALASPATGLGHICRCRNVAEVLLMRGWRVVWLLDRHAAAYFTALELVGELWLLEVGDDIQLDFPAWQAVQASFPDLAAIIVDGYLFDTAYLEGLQVLGRSVVLFDDGMISGQLPVDLVINSAVSARDHLYAGRQVGRLLLGLVYAPLRKSFANTGLSPLAQRQSLLVTFGGSDPGDLTRDFLDAAGRNAFMTALPVDLVTGAGYAGLEWLQTRLSAFPRMRHWHNTNAMQALMSAARMAISAAGSTACELGAVGIHPILVIAADNQRESAMALARSGACTVYPAGDLDWSQLFYRCRRMWLAIAAAADASPPPRWCDGHGAFRICDAIEDQLVQR